ncbi:hypothetical protein [Streptomyces sp. WAC01280]|uniref:hypothetical protein n=1 Tax=Streptomyces sp. WAC01280 TaxID=2487424 RepID=UPI000F785D6D|nr:hypothetical protein [Streptomyces sp. WAC01280]RSS59789.1 hypothetical protein EF909_07975 [Streptomyces sp. WAC01280]
MAIKRCKAAFAANINGSPHMFTVGQLVADDHPVIKGREALFEDAETYVSDRTASRVEQATAAPGEKRSVGRGTARKAEAKKPDSPPNSSSSAGGTQ